VRYQAALSRDPGVMRRLDLSLPVRIDDDGTPLARRAALLLHRSPRFDATATARISVVVHGGQQPEACLTGPAGEQIACGRVNLPVDASADVGARLLAAEFQRAAFTLKVDLSQADLTSLDGSPTAARADRQVQSLIDTLGKDPGDEPHARPRR
jgi:hypothetical protein